MFKKLIAFVLPAITVGSLIATVVIFLARGPSATDFGGSGEPCYANRSCEGDNTCYEIHSSHTFICEQQISAVVRSGFKFCYSYREPGSKVAIPACFEAENLCIVSFNGTIKQNVEIDHGCKFFGEAPKAEPEEVKPIVLALPTFIPPSPAGGLEEPVKEYDDEVVKLPPTPYKTAPAPYVPEEDVE